MSATQTTTSTNGETPAKRKRKRSASVAKPAFFIIQVLDDNGEPMKFDKSRIKLVSVERDPEKTMYLVEEGGDHPHAFYLRGIVPVSRPGQPMRAAAE